MVNRRALSLIELLVVIAIIGLLAGLAIPGMVRHLANARTEAAQTLVRTVAAAMASYGRPLVHGGGRARMRWDANLDGRGDGIIDGEPRRDPDFSEADRSWASSVGYLGFVLGVAADLPPASIDSAGRPVDPWGRPLRIAYDSRRYAQGFRVWSTGPDAADDADDIGEPERP